MVVGVPTEVKVGEQRVGLTPDGVAELVSRGSPVVVEAGAGLGSSIGDAEYRAVGAEIGTTDQVWAADLVVKVKEPQPSELDRLRPDLVLFTFLHLAARSALADRLLAAGTTAVAYETVERADGTLPLLAPMSEIAGRVAAQAGAHHLESAQGGRGILLGGAPGVRPARVVVIGAGTVGWAAARVAAGMGADVQLLDRDLGRLRWVDQAATGRVTTLASNRAAVERAAHEADMVVGAVLVTGGRAPVVIAEDVVRGMRAGAVLGDVAIDQGGCVEGIRETTHDAPVYERHGVVHYAVGNIPAAVPHTSTYALTNATLPYVAALAELGVAAAAAADRSLVSGITTVAGHLTNPAVASSLGLAFVDAARALG